MEITLSKDCDEREEGEIVEDDFEQISDSPMTPGSPLNSGKSVSSPELLSSVCLSSISCGDYNKSSAHASTNVRTYRWNGRCKCHLNRKRRNSNHIAKRKRRRANSSGCLRYNKKSSDSEEEMVNPKYVRQLRDALKHESTYEFQNSLKSRLKGFIEPISLSDDDDANLNVLRNLALDSAAKNSPKKEITGTPIELCNNELSSNEQVNESIDDNELEQLRIAALKSFVLENHERRKRKAEMLETNVKDDMNDVNKENDQSVINNDTDKKIKLDLGKSDDSDAKSVEVAEEDADILRAMLLASITKKVAGQNVITEVLPSETVLKKSVPNVTYLKPFTRTIKNDLYNGQLKNNQMTNPPLSRVIVKPLIINVSADSDSDTDPLKETVAEFLKKQRAEVEANVKKKSEASSSSLNSSEDFLMEKSAMKLLPRSQQIEYRKLKQQLINARKKTKLRKVSQRVSESNHNNKKVPKLKIGTSNNNIVNKVTGTVPEKKNGETPGNFQKTLSELQIKKNGRLQMKGKYQSLATLLHRINQASNERRQHEFEIKKLLQEIQKAKSKLAVSHQKFTNLVRQLVSEKQIIDQRSYKSSGYAHQGPFTSTPTKIINKPQISKLDNVENNTENTKCEQTQISNCENTIKETTNDEQSTVDKSEQNIVLDPNDITKVFVKEPRTFLKYTSPLDNRNELKDPLMTVCPYDLLGVCKDKECQYKHCL